MPARAANNLDGNKEMKHSLAISVQRVLGLIATNLRTLGPYLLVELILPGGSLVALLLWLYNHKPART